MKKGVSIILLLILLWGVVAALSEMPFGKAKLEVAGHYTDYGKEDTGAANIVTSVVLGYRGFDTLGEVTVLFLACIGLAVVLSTLKKQGCGARQTPSLILNTGFRFLFPLILLFGTYVFMHGHLSPGGGFQGGAVIASGFVLMYLSVPKIKRLNHFVSTLFESVGGLIFLVIGLIGLKLGSQYFLNNFLPNGEFNTLLSAGIIPVIYIAIGFKVGSELSKIIDVLLEESE
ncbi:MAG: Na(+)/H(+) antiporter subunit B [Candidatus Marinimicrobia bacterium]|nr:Na(+)/H(+) antiporter subunit B [Candidatus Neomarinimicrobiota bacterium]